MLSKRQTIVVHHPLDSQRGQTMRTIGVRQSSLGLALVAATLLVAGVGRPTAGQGLAVHASSSAWSIQKTPNPKGATSSSLLGVACPSASACIAVGTYASSSKVPVTLAEAWNGTTWSIQKTPKPKAQLAG
jgi:hypothetical protein